MRGPSFMDWYIQDLLRLPNFEFRARSQNYQRCKQRLHSRHYLKDVLTMSSRVSLPLFGIPSVREMALIGYCEVGDRKTSSRPAEGRTQRAVRHQSQWSNTTCGWWTKTLREGPQAHFLLCWLTWYSLERWSHGVRSILKSMHNEWQVCTSHTNSAYVHVTLESRKYTLGLS